MKIIGTLLKNAGSALVGYRMVIFGLRRAVKLSDNLVDDNAVEMLDAMYKNDPEKIVEYAQKAIDEALKLIEK